MLEVQLSAQVDVVAQPPEGDPLQFSVPLDGPVRLGATDPGTWRVIDFVRFGVPMSGAFLPLDRVFERPGVRLTLDSFGGVPTWSFFVRIAATGPQVLTLDEADVTLVDAHGEVVGKAIEVSSPLLEIAPGGHIDGALTFEPLERRRGVSRCGSISADPATLCRSRSRCVPCSDADAGVARRAAPMVRRGAGSGELSARAARYSSTPRFASRSASVLRSRRTCSYSIASNRAPSSRTRRCKGCRCGVFTR